MAWLLWAALAWRLWTHSPREGSIEAALFWRLARLYTRFIAHATFEGLEHVPRDRHAVPGGLIVISNHTSGIDPTLIQSVCRFEVRWMMAADMRHPAGEALWQWMRIIFVERGRVTGDARAGAPTEASPDTGAAGLREAIRHVEGGGVLGIFPEGAIERPARTLKPFQPGIGLIIRKTKAPVLPVIIEGTAYADTAWGSIFRMSRARVRFMPVQRFEGMRPDAIATALQERYQEWTGWPVRSPADEPSEAPGLPSAPAKLR